MRIYKSRFKDPATGRMRSTERLYIDFVDGCGVRRRMPTERCRTAKDAGRFAKNVEALVVGCIHGDRPDARLDTWLRSLSRGTIKRLTRFGLIDGRYGMVAKPLSQHIDDYETWLRSTVSPKFGRKRSDGHVHNVVAALRKLISDCGFRYWPDIDVGKVEIFLGRLSETAASRTYNYYVTVGKGFCEWMVSQKRGSTSPLADLQRTRTQTVTERRALSATELAALIQTTAAQGKPRFGIDPLARSIAYIVATETGLRVSELAALKVKDFDIDGDKPEPFRTPAVRLAGKFCKNRQPCEQALRRERADQLAAYFAGRDPDEPAFHLPDNTRMATLIRGDAKLAGIALQDAAGRKLVFHSLRHSTATLLDRAGVPLAVAMAILRHSTRGHITLGTYTQEASLLEKRDAVEKLPALPWPEQGRQTDRKEEVA